MASIFFTMTHVYSPFFKKYSVVVKINYLSFDILQRKVEQPDGRDLASVEGNLTSLIMLFCLAIISTGYSVETEVINDFWPFFL